MKNIRRNWKKYFILVCCMFCVVGVNATTQKQSQSLNSEQSLYEYLVQEKESINQEIITHQKKNNVDDKLAKQISNNEQLIILNATKLQSLTSFFSNQKKIHLEYTTRLKKLYQVTILPQREEIIQKKIKSTEEMLSLNEKIVTLLSDIIQSASEYQTLLLQEKSDLSLLKAKDTLHQKLKTIKNASRDIHIKLTQLYEKNIKLHEEKSNTNRPFVEVTLEKRLMVNDVAVELLQQELIELTLKKKWLLADFHVIGRLDLSSLQQLIDLSQRLLRNLSLSQTTIDRILATSKNNKLYFSDPVAEKEYLWLLTQVQGRQKIIKSEQLYIKEALEKEEDQLKTLLSSRKHFSDYRPEVWPDITAQFSAVPKKIWIYFKSLMFKWKNSYEAFSPVTQGFFYAGLFFITLFVWFTQKKLKELQKNLQFHHMSQQLSKAFLVILLKNRFYIWITLILLFSFYVAQIPMTAYSLLMDLLIVALSYQTIYALFRLFLLEREVQFDGQDVRLYHRFKRLLRLGTLVIVFMILAQQLPLSLLLQDMFNRMFMFFIFMLGCSICFNRRIIFNLLNDVLNNDRYYWFKAFRLSLILLSLTLSITAIIGLLGYINMAWTLSQYQAYLLLWIISFVIARGFLLDGLELLANYMIRHLRNGWLWVEVFLKPLSQISRFILFIVFTLLTLRIFEVTENTPWVVFIWNLIHIPLVNLSGFHMTTLSLLEFFMVLSVFIWVARWTREFCYRWLFRKLIDHALRNSLAIFIQYTVIFVGALITLHVLGVDFGGLLMILSGLAVGIGFGLRDFANNIIGGLMLLIERPVREGDLISLGGYEGKVSHIGIRTMRVSTGDNMEVLIPNAETFNKPFTNWTHRDSIVRTIVPIKISRLDCPNKVHRILSKVLKSIPEIINDPPFQVFLTHIEDALISFELRYFINIERYSRVQICSKVLFAIHDAFEKAGIHPPIQSLEVALKDEQIEKHINT